MFPMPHVARLCALAAIAFANANLLAQPAKDPTRAPIRLQQDVQPAFHVTPMSQHIHAPRGKIVPIEFQVQSINRTTTLKIRAVGLKQDENGTILSDTDAPVPDNVKVTSPTSVDLADNATTTIKARVRIPSTNSKFHSFGLLVTDLGRIVGRAPAGNAADGERTIGIRFVTRYLLRCDVTVRGVRGGDISKLTVESAELSEEDGLAKANVWVSNKTDSPFEFQMRCRLAKSNQGARQKAFNVGMVVRQSMSPPDCWMIRILPNSRLKLRGLLPDSVFPGDYEMQVDLVSNRRTRLKTSFPIAIKAGDFPGQDATIIQFARDIQIAPTQVALSLRRGGKRFRSVELTNNSQQPIEISLTPRSVNGSPVNWVMVRPNTVQLNPGRYRKVLIGMNMEEKFERHQYGTIHIDATPSEGKTLGRFELPVALLARSEEQPNVELESERWSYGAEQSAFVIPIVNTGQMHATLDGMLKLTDPFGRIIELRGGYGHWLLPGERDELLFRTKYAPPPGEYHLKLRMETGEGIEPLESSQQMQILGIPQAQQLETR